MLLMHPINGQRVRLRLATVADASAMVAAMEPSTTQNLQFFSEPTDLHRQVEYLQRMTLSPSDVLFVIERLEDNAIVGTTGLHEIDSHIKLARLGVLIFRTSDRSHGYGDEALRLIIEFAFRELGLNKVIVNPFKKKNGHTAYFESLGFRVEGELREEYLLNGAYHNLIRMGLLAREWRAAHA